MSNFSLQVPINSTSLGQVSTNVLYEIYKKELEPSIFPIGHVDLSSFDGLLPEEFAIWLQSCCQKSLRHYRYSDPSLRIWHINGSHENVSNKPFLYFFHELDQITKTEKNILNNFVEVFSPCSFTENICKEYGVKKISTVNLGFNSLAFKEVPVEKYENGETVITLAGKFEKRKHTAKMIKILADNYGNSQRFKIHLHVYNPFFDRDPERCQMINYKQIEAACGGKIPYNFVLMAHFPQLTDLNKCYNVTDVVVDGSGGESWSLPSFHMCGLGKQNVTHFNSGTKEWANDKNSYLIDSDGKESAEDGMFFSNSSPFNNGNIYTFDEEDMVKKIDEAVKNKSENVEGKKLQEEFTYKKMVDEILEKMWV